MSNARVDLPEPDSAGEHDELVLGDVEADVFQVVQAGIADADGGVHNGLHVIIGECRARPHAPCLKRYFSMMDLSFMRCLRM